LTGDFVWAGLAITVCVKTRGLANRREGHLIIMDITYFGTNTGAGPQEVKIRHSNGNTTILKKKIIWHRDGFQWGYGGSGPAYLAVNMLFDYLLRTHRKNARAMAIDLHQSFKWDFIARQGKELKITGADIEKWLGSAQTLQQLTGENEN